MYLGAAPFRALDRPSGISRFPKIDQKLCRTAQSIEFREIPRNQWRKTCM